MHTHKPTNCRRLERSELRYDLTSNPSPSTIFARPGRKPLESSLQRRSGAAAGKPERLQACAPRKQAINTGDSARRGVARRLCDVIRVRGRSCGGSEPFERSSCNARSATCSSPCRRLCSAHSCKPSAMHSRRGVRAVSEHCDSRGCRCRGSSSHPRGKGHNSR